MARRCDAKLARWFCMLTLRPSSCVRIPAQQKQGLPVLGVSTSNQLAHLAADHLSDHAIQDQYRRTGLLGDLMQENHQSFEGNKSWNLRKSRHCSWRLPWQKLLDATSLGSYSGRTRTRGFCSPQRWRWHCLPGC